MIMNKRVLTMLLTASMAAGLAGCGGIKTTEDGAATTAATEAPASTAAATESSEAVKESSAPAEGETVVTFWHSLNGSAGEALNEVIENYNSGRGKEKGIRVNLVFQGYEGTDKVILAYQTGDTANAPDINQGLTSTIPSMMDLDWTVDLTDRIANADNTVKADDFYPAMVRS